MTFCYVLAGDSVPRLRMLHASLVSLRRVHPESEVRLFVHPADLSIPRETRNLVDTVVAPDLADVANSAEAARALKTSLRQCIDGHYVYLDLDTLIVRQLDALESQREVAAVRDRSYTYPIPPCIPRWVRRVFRQLRWDLPLLDYFNSGVIVWPDSERTRALSARWHFKWLQAKAVGIVEDQPALNAADVEAGGVIQPLAVSYNAMIDADPGLATGAHIIHFFNSARAPFGRNLLEQLVAAGPVSEAAVLGVLRRIKETDWPFERPARSKASLAGSFLARSFTQFARMGLGRVLR